MTVKLNFSESISCEYSLLMAFPFPICQDDIRGGMILIKDIVHGATYSSLLS